MPAEWASLAWTLFRVASTVIALAGSAQRYRKKCALLANRVQGIRQHLDDLRRAESTPDPAGMVETLKSLEKVLKRAEDLVGSCQRKRKPFDFFTAPKNIDEFAFLNESINNLLNNFHIANRTLIKGLFSDKIFTVVLRMLLQTDAGGRILQDKRDEVEKYIEEFPCDENNMTAEKKEVLALIKEILSRQEPVSRDAAAVAPKATTVQRVAQLTRHALSFLPNLRFPRMTRHPDTQRAYERIKYD